MGWKMNLFFTIMTVPDRILNTITKPISRAWSFITGKSSVTLSRLMLCVGYAIYAVGYCARFATEGGFLNGMVVFFILPYWLYLCKGVLTAFKYLEEEFESPSPDGVIQLNRDVLAAFMMRVFLSTFWLLFEPLVLPQLTGWSLVTEIGWTILVFAFYPAWHGYQPGKGVFSKAKDKASALVQKAKELIPSPLPTPVPIPVTG